MEIATDVPNCIYAFLGRYRLVDSSNMVNSDISTVGVIMPFNHRSLADHLGSGKDWNLDRKSGGLFILPGSAFGTFCQVLVSCSEIYFQCFAILRELDAEYVLLSTSNFVFNSDLTELLDQHLESDAHHYDDLHHLVIMIDVVGVELTVTVEVKTQYALSAETRLLRLLYYQARPAY